MEKSGTLAAEVVVQTSGNELARAVLDVGAAAQRTSKGAEASDSVGEVEVNAGGSHAVADAVAPLEGPLG